MPVRHPDRAGGQKEALNGELFEDRQFVGIDLRDGAERGSVFDAAGGEGGVVRAGHAMVVRTSAAARCLLKLENIMNAPRMP